MAGQDTTNNRKTYNPSEMLKNAVEDTVASVVSAPTGFLNAMTEQMGLSNSEDLYASEKCLAKEQEIARERQKTTSVYENLYDSVRTEEQRQVDALLAQLSLEVKKVQQTVGETVTVVKSANEMLIAPRQKRNGKYFVFFISHILSLVRKLRQDVAQAGVWYLEMVSKGTSKHFAMFGGKGFNPTSAFSGERAQAFSAN